MNMNNDKKCLVGLCFILMFIIAFLSWKNYPTQSQVILIALISSSLWFVIGYLVKQCIEPSNNCSLLPNREALKMSERLKSAKKEIFIVGFTLETTMQFYSEIFKKALENKVKLRLLFTHPESSYVTAHQPFANRDLKVTIHSFIQKLKSFFESLDDEDAKNRIQVKATYYLPRFSAVIIDNELMMLNFYMFKSPAQCNPSLEIYRCKYRKEFDQIKNSLENIFNIESSTESFNENNSSLMRVPPNYIIVENGTFNEFS